MVARTTGAASPTASASGEGLLRPVAVTTAAKEGAQGRSGRVAPEPELVTAPAEEAEDARAVAERKGRRTGRFGPTFGTTVHVAIATALESDGASVIDFPGALSSDVGRVNNQGELNGIYFTPPLSFGSFLRSKQGEFFDFSFPGWEIEPNPRSRNKRRAASQKDPIELSATFL